MPPEFMSLREFLLLKDRTDGRSVFTNEYLPRSLRKKLGLPCPDSLQEDSVGRYDIAKASWEKYGEDGPPVGSKVLTLRCGHGGEAGMVRFFQGLWGEDKRFFFLSKDGCNEVSLVLRATWFTEVLVID